MKLSIIIPTFNEERTIEQLIRCVLATEFPLEYEVVVIDDHSTDQTFLIAQRLQESCNGVQITLVQNRTNKGKGACIRQGLKHASGELLIIQDGDLEYSPGDIPKLLAPILEGRADVVYGSRFGNGAWPRGMAWTSFLANRVLTWLTNRLYHMRLTDMETCYKVLRREQLETMALRANRFEFEPEVTAQLAKRNIGIHEIPISYDGRTGREGKKIGAKDFFIAMWTLVRCRLS